MQPHLTQQTYRFVPLFFLVFFLFIWSPSSAQRRSSRGLNADGDILGGSNHSSGGHISKDGWLAGINFGYEAPLGDIKEVYKAAPTFGLTVMRRMGNLVYSGTVDYRAYKPRQDTISDTYTGVGTFKEIYSNYTGIGLYAGIAYELELGMLNVYAGVNVGTVITKYQLKTTQDGDEVLNLSAATNSTYLGPKLGFNFAVSNNISLGLEGRYSLGVVGGSYNSREGGSVTKGFNSYAGNVFLTYGF